MACSLFVFEIQESVCLLLQGCILISVHGVIQRSPVIENENVKIQPQVMKGTGSRHRLGPLIEFI